MRRGRQFERYVSAFWPLAFWPFSNCNVLQMTFGIVKNYFYPAWQFHNYHFSVSYFKLIIIYADSYTQAGVYAEKQQQYNHNTCYRKTKKFSLYFYKVWTQHRNTVFYSKYQEQQRHNQNKERKEGPHRRFNVICNMRNYVIWRRTGKSWKDYIYVYVISHELWTICNLLNYMKAKDPNTTYTVWKVSIELHFSLRMNNGRRHGCEMKTSVNSPSQTSNENTTTKPSKSTFLDPQEIS